MNFLSDNPIMDADSYKPSHWLQMPPNTTNMSYYLESRGGRYGQTLFFGLQPILKTLEKRITKENVDEAEVFFAAHGVPFNRQGWMYIVEKLDGKIPLKIRAVAEGTVVPTNNVLMTVEVCGSEETKKNCFWVPSYFETMLMRVWYPITVATQSWHCKRIIMEYLEKTSDDPKGEIAFKLHDFGSRGVSSRESAAMGGAAHLVNFKGSDTLVGVLLANKIYKCPMSAFSIPAAEHSTITPWEKEVEAYRNMLKQFARPGALLAVVSDSVDLENAVDNLWGKELNKEVVDSGATVIIRPDSGNPPDMVLMTLKLLDKNFGSTYNKKGYKVLNHVRVIQGDGINEDTIREILRVSSDAGYSATNIAFGMGGALLQQVNRDTQRFAYKCCAAVINGVERDVFKNPKQDPGKASKAGRQDLVQLASDGGKFKTVRGTDTFGSVLKVVFDDGTMVKEYVFDDVRARSEVMPK